MALNPLELTENLESQRLNTQQHMPQDACGHALKEK